MGYTYQEARQAWRDLRFSIAYSSSDGDLARKLDAFFEVGKPAAKRGGPPDFKYGTPARRCTLLVENDEHACHCGLRWDAKEDKPPCPHGHKE